MKASSLAFLFGIIVALPLFGVSGRTDLMATIMIAAACICRAIEGRDR